MAQDAILHARVSCVPLLVKRAMVLSGVERPSPENLVELRAVLRLADGQSISPAWLDEAIIAAYGLGSEVDLYENGGEFVFEFVSRMRVFGRLYAWLSGDPALDVTEIESTLSLTPQEWAKRVLGQVADYVQSGVVRGVDTSNIHGALRRELEFDFATKWFASPYTLGASLHDLPVKGGRLFGNELAPALLRALTSTVSDLLDRIAFERPSVETDPKLVEDLYGRLLLHWMILKGFVYAAVQSPDLVTGLLAQIRNDAVLIGDVSQALLEGIEAFKNVDDDRYPQWSGCGSELDSKIENTAVTRLVTLFRQACTDARHHYNKG